MELGHSYSTENRRLDKGTSFLSKATAFIVHEQIPDIEIRLRAPFEFADGEFRKP